MNVDKSLGELISSRKTATRGRGAARGRRGGARAPVGGVAKNTSTKATAHPARGAAKTAAVAAAVPTHAAGKGNKKILVSGLPLDVKESHIKEYFGTRVGPIAKIDLSYDSKGKSRGIATVLFRRDDAQKAVAEHNGIQIDGKPLRVEVVYDAAHLPGAEAPKSLSERVSRPKKEAITKKDQPKKVDSGKKERDGATAGKTARGAKRGRNAGRPKKKTAEELDTEMEDYFGVGGQPAIANSGEAPAAASAPAAGTAMDEEVL